MRSVDLRGNAAIMSVVPDARRTKPQHGVICRDIGRTAGSAYSYFLEQSRVMPLDGVGHDAVQIPPLWILGCNVVPSFDRHVTEAMISPTPHSEVHPTEPQVSLPIDLT
jgi:hypothetical protein